MTKQIKVLLVFLAVLAVVSVFSFFDIFKGVRSANLHDTIEPLTPIIDDADQDGVSDNDEAYWNTDFQNPDTDGDGFLDGEEIASGFDPRIVNSVEGGDNLIDILGWSPQPIDLNPEDLNITDNFTKIIAGGIAAGDLNPRSEDAEDIEKQNQNLNYLALTVIDDFYKTQTFTPPELKIIENSKENQTHYLNSIAEVIKENLIDFTQSVSFNMSFLDQSEYFSGKSDKFNLSYNKIASLSVPKDWVDIHNNILSILHRFSLNYTFIASYESDPLKAVTALDEVINLNFETQTLLSQIQLQISANDLILDNDIYQLLDLIYKSRE